MALEQVVQELGQAFSNFVVEALKRAGVPVTETGSTETESTGKRGPGRPRREAPADITLEQIQAAAKKVADEKGQPVAVKLIGDHGGKKTKDIPKANYAAFLAACDVILSAKPAEEPDEDDDEGL